jgi:hypothetical protein
MEWRRSCCSNHTSQQHPRDFNDARLKLLCQNQTNSSRQLRYLAIPSIAFNSDELTFDTFMEKHLRATNKKSSDQCDQIPTVRVGEDILKYYSALKQHAICKHSICVFCLRKSFSSVCATIRCKVYSLV